MSIQLENLAISGQTVDMERDEIAAALEQFRELDVPEVMDNSIINIEGDPEGSIVMFSSRLPEGQTPLPLSEVNILSFNVEDGQLLVAAGADPEYLSNFASLFDTILEYIDLHITDFDAMYSIDRGFNELNIEITGPDEFDYRGVRFRQSGLSFIVQDSSGYTWHDGGLEEGEENNEEDDEQTSVAVVNNIEHFDVEEDGHFMRTKTDQAQELLERLL